jgi:hypothetical protein
MVNWNQNEVQCRCKPGYRPVDQSSMKCQIGKLFRPFSILAPKDLNYLVFQCLDLKRN